MRIRHGRSLASLSVASCNNGGNEDLHFLQQQPIGDTVASSPSIAPAAAPCQVNRSPWDVSAIVLAFFHLDQAAPVLRDVEEEEAITSSDTALPSIRTESKSVRDSPLHLTAHSPPRDAQPIPSAAPEKEKELPVVRTKNKNRKGGYCKRKDGKGWTCKAPAKSGSSFCDHHLSQLRSYSSKKAADGRSSSKKPQFPPSKEEGSNESHYHYHMGFGPARKETRRNSGVPSLAAAAGTVFSTTDEEEEEEEEERGETRRQRKRVKCRSLKSLLNLAERC